MTPQEAKLARERMAANPFAPSDGPVDLHSAHALNYVAFYLGEIEKHMGKIATNSELVLTRLKEIQGSVAKK